MEPGTRIFLVAIGLVVLISVINLMRTRQLQERFALLWLLAASGLVVAPLLINYIDRAVYALGFTYPPAVLLVFAVIGLLFILFQFSLNISRFHEQIKVLTQELALLQHQVDELNTELEKYRTREALGE